MLKHVKRAITVGTALLPQLCLVTESKRDIMELRI